MEAWMVKWDNPQIQNKKVKMRKIHSTGTDSAKILSIKFCEKLNENQNLNVFNLIGFYLMQ